MTRRQRSEVVVALVLDPYGARATCAMHGREWAGDQFAFALRRAGEGYALRTPCPVDPSEERHATWEEAVAAFADLVRFHVADVLGAADAGAGVEVGTLERLSQDEMRRLARAVFGTE